MCKAAVKETQFAAGTPANTLRIMQRFCFSQPSRFLVLEACLMATTSQSLFSVRSKRGSLACFTVWFWWSRFGAAVKSSPSLEFPVPPNSRLSWQTALGPQLYVPKNTFHLPSSSCAQCCVHTLAIKLFTTLSVRVSDLNAQENCVCRQRTFAI